MAQRKKYTFSFSKAKYPLHTTEENIQSLKNDRVSSNQFERKDIDVLLSEQNKRKTKITSVCNHSSRWILPQLGSSIDSKAILGCHGPGE